MNLDADLDVVVSRKLGSPVSAELAIGAVTGNGGRFLNNDLIRTLNVSDAYLTAVTETQQAEARRRETSFRGSPEACAALRGEADEVVCLYEPTYFGAVGYYYRDFAQTQDSDVQTLLEESAATSLMRLRLWVRP